MHYQYNYFKHTCMSKVYRNKPPFPVYLCFIPDKKLWIVFVSNELISFLIKVVEKKALMYTFLLYKPIHMRSI